MTTLILPVAGKSSRFPGMRPKWLLTMPDGKIMLEKAVERLALNNFSRIVIPCLKEHLEVYASKDRIIESFANATGRVPEIKVLDEPTFSQAETIAKTITHAEIEGAVFIKDCDNMFGCNIDEAANFVCTINLNQVSLIDAKNKSYVEVDSLGIISNIVEKEVISNLFCCGGYGFLSAQQFYNTYSKIHSSNEVYVSHIIYKMLLDGVEFKKVDANNYVDWGTQREYRDFCHKHITVFCDIDGVLLKNGSKFANNGWHTHGIAENIESLKKLQDRGVLYLILTSSRPESELEWVREVLNNCELKFDRHLFGLPHNRRILINDYSATNPYPSAISINLERDSNSLRNLLSHLDI